MRFLKTLRARLLLSFLLPASVLFAVVGLSGYQVSKGILESELSRSLEGAAAAISSQLQGELVLTLQPGDDRTQTRVFKKTARTVDDLRISLGLRRVFLVDRDRRVRLDLGGKLPIGAEAPELSRDGREVERALAGEKIASTVTFVGTDGQTYKTGYAPLKSEDSVVGVVAVEGTAAFYGPLAALFRGFAVAAVLGLLGLGLIAIFTAEALTRPIRRLMSSALRIGAGDLQTKVAPEQSHEIGVLARELEAMRQALEGRDRQLKMMIAGVAHEVKNPLGGMELFTGLLREELPASATEAREHLGRVTHELDYLKRIVDDFLAFAREERMNQTALSGRRVLESARDHLLGEATAKGVKLQLEAEEGTFAGDEGLLTSALVNLMKNAIQASPASGTVTLTGRAESGSYVVRVVDEGPGIPSEARERIFEPFFTTREKGTGLGLPLALKIAQAHQGTLTLQSAPGKTEFAIRLPMAA